MSLQCTSTYSSMFLFNLVVNTNLVSGVQVNSETLPRLYLCSSHATAPEQIAVRVTSIIHKHLSLNFTHCFARSTSWGLKPCAGSCDVLIWIPLIFQPYPDYDWLPLLVADPAWLWVNSLSLTQQLVMSDFLDYELWFFSRKHSDLLAHRLVQASWLMLVCFVMWFNSELIKPLNALTDGLQTTMAAPPDVSLAW